jgi:protein TonB
MGIERRMLAALAVLLLHAAAIGVLFWKPRQESVRPREILVRLELVSVPDDKLPPEPIIHARDPPTRQPIHIALPPLSVVPSVSAESQTSPTDAVPATPEAAPIASHARLEPPASRPQSGAAASDYASLLAAALARVKRYPAEARNAREEGTVELLFELDRSGKVLAWRIAQSSGHPVLDTEVAQMVAAAAPFPPFPPSMPQARESFLVPIEFSLHRGG